jgi:hypothetical protein
MASALESGPIFIRSADNPRLALTVVANPPAHASQVTLEAVDAADWNTPLSQWVVNAVAEGVFQVALFASAGALLLEAASDDLNANVQVGNVDPANNLQLWRLELDATDQWLASVGASDFQVGFSGDIPVPGMAVQLMTPNDTHNLGDKFALVAVRSSSDG